MKIVISGLGEIGHYLAEILLKEGHDLILIEKNEKRYLQAQERLDAQIVNGDSASALVLEPLVDENTDILAAVTDDDNVNVITALIASRFGVKRVIVRITDPSNLIHPLLTDDPKVSVLNAEMIVAKDLARLVGNPYADEIEFFAGGRAEMVKLHVGENAAISYKKLKEINIPPSWLFIARIRKGEFTILSGDCTLEPGDQLLVMGDPRKSKEIEELLGLRVAKIRRVVLAGFNPISFRLAQTLKRRNIEVRLIEEDKGKAEQAAAVLDGVLILQGDSTSEDILAQAGIDQTDYLLALTDDDETNVLISLLAKERNVQRVIALAQKPQYKPIIEKVGIDTVVNPRSSMVDEIIRSIHHEDLSGITILEGGLGSMIELVVKKKTNVVDVPLSRVRLPKQMLIGAIVRDDKLIIPKGEDRIRIGDNIVIFTIRSVLADVKKIFGL